MSAISPNGRFAVWGISSTKVELFKIEDKKLQKMWDQKFGEGNRSCVFSPDSKILAVGGRNQTYLWEVKTSQVLNKIEHEMHTKVFYSCCAIDPHNQLIALGDDYGQVQLREIKTGRLVRKLKGHRALITQSVFSHDGNTLVSASKDRTLKLWHVRSGKLLQTFPNSAENILPKGHTSAVNFCAFDPKDEMIISGGDDKLLKLWNAKTGALIRDFKGHRTSISACDISPDGSKIISTSINSTVKLWELKRENPRILKGHTKKVNACAFSPNGAKIVSVSSDLSLILWDTLRIWDVERGEQLFSLEGHTGIITSCAFSRDGRKIVSASNDHTLRVWDAGPDAILPIRKQK